MAFADILHLKQLLEDDRFVFLDCFLAYWEYLAFGQSWGAPHTKITAAGFILRMFVLLFSGRMVLHNGTIQGSGEKNDKCMA